MPKQGLTLEKSGRFKTGGDLRSAVERVIGPALNRAGLALEGGIKGVTPVVTGNLRRTVNTGHPEWRGSVYLVKVGPNAVYASRVNRTSRKNHGFIKRGIDGSKGRAKAELEKGAKAFALEHVWVKS